MTDWRSMRFGRAAGSYHEATPMQRWMASRLLELEPSGWTCHTILELGCGTGHLTRLLASRFPQAKITATDLAPAMLAQARLNWPAALPSPNWAPLDARTPGAIGFHPDLVASNAVVQWFPDLEEHFRAIRATSMHGARYLLSGFSSDHFPELERILASAEFGYPPGPGHDPSRALDAAKRAGWTPKALHEESRIEAYATPLDFLRHLKASGANRPPPEGKPLTRARLQRLLERLATEAKTENGIQITWKPWFLLLEAT